MAVHEIEDIGGMAGTANRAGDAWPVTAIGNVRPMNIHLYASGNANADFDRHGFIF